MDRRMENSQLKDNKDSEKESQHFWEEEKEQPKFLNFLPTLRILYVSSFLILVNYMISLGFSLH